MQSIKLSIYPTPNLIAQPPKHTPNPQNSIDNVLNAIFPQQTEENKITRTRKTLDETAKTLSDEQIECINTKFQFLIESWLDEYEKEIFGEMTLKKILNEK